MHIIIKETVSNIPEAQQLVDVSVRDNDENQQIGLKRWSTDTILQNLDLSVFRFPQNMKGIMFSGSRDKFAR